MQALAHAHRRLEIMPVLQLQLCELPGPEPRAVALRVEWGRRTLGRECEEVEGEAETRDGHA